jgi:membrane-bound lytic murein transglycosylase D
MDLVYLPHVESSFNPKAYSKFGASGIWQFTRTTGRRFLTISYTVDERMDPISSSKGAALLLKSHYEKLQNWPIAITAYNHGIAGMLRAKKLKGNYERIFQEYKSRIFKFASKNFYSEFLAARDAVKNYQKYFGDLKLDSPPATQEVVLPGYVSLKELAEHFNTHKDVLKNLNPSLREPVCLGQKYVPKGYALSIPVDLASSSFDAVGTLPLDLVKPHQKPSEFYRVQSGDTASVVAEMHGISLRDLIIANDLNSRATIYAGEILRLPLPPGITDPKAEL